MTMPEDRVSDDVRLKELAEKATPGEWLRGSERKCRIDQWSTVTEISICSDHLIAKTRSASELAERDADYIVAAQPQTILSLLSRLEQLGSEVARLTSKMEELGLVEMVEFDDEDRTKSRWVNARADSAESRLAEVTEALRECQAHFLSLGGLPHHEHLLAAIDAALSSTPATPPSREPALTVEVGEMRESGNRLSYYVTLYRSGDKPWDGMSIERCPTREDAEAEAQRWREFFAPVIGALAAMPRTQEAKGRSTKKPPAHQDACSDHVLMWSPRYGYGLGYHVRPANDAPYWAVQHHGIASSATFTTWWPLPTPPEK